MDPSPFFISVPSLHRESTDSLIQYSMQRKLRRSTRTNLIKRTESKEYSIINHMVMYLFKHLFSSNLLGQSSNVAVVLCRVYSILLLHCSWCIHTHSIRTDLDIIIMWVIDQIKYVWFMSYNIYLSIYTLLQYILQYICAYCMHLHASAFPRKKSCMKPYEALT